MPISRAIAAAVVSALLGAASTAELSAQARDGAIYGSVAAEGQPVAGATITVIGTGAPYVDASDDRGQFRLLSLPPGALRDPAPLVNAVPGRVAIVAAGGAAQ